MEELLMEIETDKKRIELNIKLCEDICDLEMEYLNRGYLAALCDYKNLIEEMLGDKF